MSRIFRTNRSVLCISILILIQCWISSINFGCVAQDDFQDDAGADTTGNDATNDMLDHDPNTLNPQKNQMSGNNVPATITDNYQGRSIAQYAQYKFSFYTKP